MSADKIETKEKPLQKMTVKDLREMAKDLLLSSTRVESKKLLESGYKFRQPTLEQSLRHVLGK